MGTVGKSLIRGANEALAIAKGEMCAATILQVKSVQVRFNNENDHELQKYVALTEQTLSTGEK